MEKYREKGNGVDKSYVEKEEKHYQYRSLSLPMMFSGLNKEKEMSAMISALTHVVSGEKHGAAADDDDFLVTSNMVSASGVAQPYSTTTSSYGGNSVLKRRREDDDDNNTNTSSFDDFSRGASFPAISTIAESSTITTTTIDTKQMEKNSVYDYEYKEENVSREDCLQTCEKENNPYQKQVCQVSCSLLERDDEEEHGKQPRPHPQPQPQPQPHREKGDEDEREQPSPRPHNHPGKKDKEHEEDEREQQQPRPHKPHQESEDQQQGDEEEDSESESPRQGRNPFYFSSDGYQTLFRNQYGQIRLLQRFDKRSRKLQNLEDYRILEFRSKPRTLLLPHHDDAEFLLFVQSGRAIITFVNPDNRDSYNLESGDAIRIPAGTTFYVVNPQENENLRIIKLALPVNNPRRIQSFFLSSTEEQQSYLEGFSSDILEASLDTGYEEIHRVLLGDKNRGQKRQELEGVFVEISEEQIRELRRNAKSSSRKTLSSEDEPFNLRSNKPVHSNNFGKFFEITPEKNPQLKDLDVSLSYLDINEGGLLLPNYQSKSTLILAVDNGEAEIEVVGLRKSQEKQQQEEQQGPREVRRYRAELSQDDIVVVPAGYPFAIKATSNVRLLAFGINAENNQRNFLAGEKDNLLRQLHRQVKDLAFPGSAEEFEKLIQNQRESYFADAQSQQGQEERRGKKGPLSSILGALY